MKKNGLLETFFYDFLKSQVTNWTREILITFENQSSNDESDERQLNHWCLTPLLTIFQLYRGGTRNVSTTTFSKICSVLVSDTGYVYVLYFKFTCDNSKLQILSFMFVKGTIIFYSLLLSNRFLKYNDLSNLSQKKQLYIQQELSSMMDYW